MGEKDKDRPRYQASWLTSDPRPPCVTEDHKPAFPTGPLPPLGLRLVGPLSSPALVSPPQHLKTQTLLLPLFKLLLSQQPPLAVSYFLSPSDPLLPTSLSNVYPVLLLAHAAALSASLWLGIPAVVTNPRFLVANWL